MSPAFATRWDRACSNGASKSTRYSAAGVRRFAFLLPEGAPIPPMMNQSATRENFLTRGFNSLEQAMAWLAASD